MFASLINLFSYFVPSRSSRPARLRGKSLVFQVVASHLQHECNFLRRVDSSERTSSLVSFSNKVGLKTPVTIDSALGQHYPKRMLAAGFQVSRSSRIIDDATPEQRLIRHRGSPLDWYETQNISTAIWIWQVRTNQMVSRMTSISYSDIRLPRAVRDLVLCASLRSHISNPVGCRSKHVFIGLCCLQQCLPAF